MIDISDGIGKDLREVMKESSVGVSLEAKKLPISDNIIDDNNAIERALSDGEDFELCLYNFSVGI